MALAVTHLIGFGMRQAVAGQGGGITSLSISGTPVLTATEGVAYAGFTATGDGGDPPYTFSLVGTWPTGISINSSTGEVSGTPTESGTFASLSVRVTDNSSGTRDLPTFTLEVAVATTNVVVLVAGQSNARSYDTTGSDVPVSLQDSDANIKIWNTHTQAWETYAAGTNSDTWNSGASTPQKWGPEAGFAHASRDADASRVIHIIKIAVDSTELAADAGEDWSPSNTGELFDDMDTEIAAAVAAMGITPDEYVLLWMQGEHDALNSTYATNYGVNLVDFVTAVRSDWGDASTKVIIGRITPSTEWATGGSAVRAFQARVGRAVADVTVIDTDGYTLAGDNKHYVAASVQTMGEDMYDAYIGTYPLLPVRFGTMAADKSASVALSNGNLTASGTGTDSAALQLVRCDQVVNGKSYWEIQVDAQTGTINIGLGKGVSLSGYWGQAIDSVGYNSNGEVRKNGSLIATYATYTAGDRIMVGHDGATGEVWFGKNGSWNGNPAAGTGEVTTLSATTPTAYHRIGVTCRRSGDQMTLKAAAADLAYSPPTGFAAI